MGQPRAKAPRFDLSSYEMAFKLLVTPHAAGKIIGRGGAEIANLRKELGVGCHIHGPENQFPRTDLQVAVLFGNCSSIEQALSFVVGKCAEAESGLQGPLTLPVVMTRNTVSMVIGTKGATIAGLRQESGCQFAAEKEAFLGEQLIRVTGSVEALPAALSLLTPFVEKGGDSISFALQEYGGGWGDEWSSPYSAPKGLGKGMDSAPKGVAKGMGAQKGFAQKGKGAIGEPPGWGGAPLAPPPRKGSFSSKGFPAAAPRPKGGWVAGALTAGEEWRGGAVEEDDPQVLDSPCTIAFTIPAETVGRVLGKGGSSSAEIRRATGVALQIDSDVSEGTVTLTGPLGQVHRAHRMVVGRVVAPY